MFPTSNGLGQNLADAMRVRESRLQGELTDPGSMNPVLTVAQDPRWDAFFGAMQRTADDAADAGLKFRVNTAGFGNLRPSLAALKRSY